MSDGLEERDSETDDLDEAVLVEVLSVRVAGAVFGLPVDRVRSVIRVPVITRLPFPPPATLGVASVRGSLIPVIDLGERLLNRPSSRTGRLVLVEDPASPQEIGLLVDAVVGLASGPLQTDDIPAEVEASLPPGWVAGLLAPAPDSLITLLELEPVLAVGVPTEKEQR